MKKHLPKISISVLLVVSVLFFLPHIASAQGIVANAILAIPGQIAARLLLPFVGYLTSFTGLVLNYIVYQTIVHMADLFPNGGAIDQAWSTMRDVANMSFIFILLYSAIMTIFGQGKTRELIVKIIVAAILINFSLFFTRVIIDASNVVAVTIYDSIAPGAVAGSGSDIANAGLSNSIMTPLDAQTIFKYTGNLDGTKLLTIGLMGSVFALAAAFVFIAISILLVIRFVVLVFIMILSPLMVLGGVLPGLSGVRKQWMDSLIGQAVFAPLFFLLMWIVLKIGGALHNGSNISSLGNALAGTIQAGSGGTDQVVTSASTMGLVFNFVLMIGMLVAAMVMSKSWAGKGAKQIGQLSGWATGTVMGKVGGLGRTTFGRAGQAVADSEFLKDKAPNNRMARLALAAGNKTAKSSFDVRGSALGSIIGGGKVPKGSSFAEESKKRADDAKKYGDSLKPSDLVVARAERNLDDAKKSGDAARIKAAQDVVDRLKGADENEMRKREIQRRREEAAERGEFISEKKARQDLEREETERRIAIKKETERLKAAEGLSHEDASKKAKETITAGWAPKAVKGAAIERKEAVAKKIETPSRIDTDRVAFIGPIKKEALAAALAVRRSIKDKKPAEKIAEEIEKQAKEASDSGGEASAPTSGGEKPEKNPSEGSRGTSKAPME